MFVVQRTASVFKVPLPNGANRFALRFYSEKIVEGAANFPRERLEPTTLAENRAWMEHELKRVEAWEDLDARGLRQAMEEAEKLEAASPYYR